MKAIPGLQGYYADENGDIWSTKAGRYERWKSPHKIAAWTDRRGYKHVTLRADNEQKRHMVHRLVCSAYNDPSKDGGLCLHLDGNPGNNRPENLKYGSQKENKSHEKMHGTKLLGERLPWATLTNETVRNMKRDIAAGLKPVEIARFYKVNVQTIYAIACGRNWKHIVI